MISWYLNVCFHERVSTCTALLPGRYVGTSYSARDRGGDGPKQKQHAAARAASGAERVLPETTWMGTGPPDEQPPADAVAVGKQPKAKPRKEALFATYSY